MKLIHLSFCACVTGYTIHFVALVLLLGDKDGTNNAVSGNGGVATALAVKKAQDHVRECQEAHLRHVYRTALQVNSQRAWTILPRNQRNDIPTILFCLQQGRVRKS
jgi:hypothetical protein